MHLNQTIQRLAAFEAPRVWSLLVTIFGDMACEPEDQLDGRLLMRLTGEIGVKPEAVRVALHRLRNDGWISSVKTGRTAMHTLTPQGRAQTLAVSSLVYAPLSDLPDTVQIALTQSNDSATREDMTAQGFIQLAPRIFIAPQPAKSVACAWFLTPDSVPDWVRDQVLPNDWTAQFSNLLTLLKRTSHDLNQPAIPDHARTALLRILVIHYWRRLVLRHPYLPPILTGDEWPGHLCRNEVTQLLDRLPRVSLAELRDSIHL